ncbi:hypothetical protein HDU82_000274 [Entophlyctis luteolus]|nr:hypothetical protein HDU82_000274 [Entophlyctis luteolus]
MRQVVFDKADSVSLREGMADPLPGAGEVRVRVKAFGVNYADIMMRKGIYFDAPPFPNVAGYEVSGVVDSAGAGVPAGWVGKAVIALTMFGGYADTVVVPVAQCIEKPAAVSHVEAAGLAVPYLTAWMLLAHMGALRPAQVVAVHNAGSGVGLAAVDIARHLGAVAVGTASAGKHAFLRERGYAHVFERDAFKAGLMDVTGGKGADLIVDPIGGRDSWNANFKCLRKGGRLGASTMSDKLTAGGNGVFGWMFAWLQIGYALVVGAPKWSPVGLMGENKAVFGVNLAKMFEDIEYPVEWLKEIAQGVVDGWVHPHIDSIYGIDNVRAAHQRVEDRKSIGKVVIVIDASDTEHDKHREKFVL